MLEAQEVEAETQERQLQAAIDASNSTAGKSQHEDLERQAQESQTQKAEEFEHGTVVRTLDGDIAGDEFAADALNYQILLGKIDMLLESLKLDA